MFQAFKDIHPSHTSSASTSGTGGTGTGGSGGTSESAGTRYKTQFNLLTSSLTKNKLLLRPSLLQSILSLSLPPGSLALLSASDLASAAQLEEMERAKQAVLESTVKTREEREMEREMLGGGGGGMIAGRDGLEQLEDTREKEMWEVRKEEERERERSRSAQYAHEHESRGEHQYHQPRERRESEMERDSVHTDNDGSASKDVELTTETTRTRHGPSRSPTILHPHQPQQRRTSTALAPASTTPFKIEPAKPVFELTSAWGTATSNILHDEGNGPSDHRLEQDQEKLDLSDQVIVSSVGGVGGDGEKGDLDLDLDLGYGSGEMDLDELDYTGELDASTAAAAASAAADSQGGGAIEIENREKERGVGDEGGEENRQRKKWEELMNRPIEWTGRVSFSQPLFFMVQRLTGKHFHR